MDNLENIEKINHIINLILKDIFDEKEKNITGYNEEIHPLYLIEQISENLFEILNELNSEEELNYKVIIDGIKNSLLKFLSILHCVYKEIEEDLNERKKDKDDENNIISIV
ncbi:hypothetical protein QEJ31_03220 [Pigmentibacter sp. JX0631]|uniref:hypothetical protein n=1 Tax=Pigmentibacter sp. JX0631 TaxID=2976982 RepID=UPI002469B162|nr:hypothetical protein [Pigmentibacter sp. JX0631]WGL60612.1 hypothetical protein QEJ31_03220 [Pigmentibacter sp. JX0631]